MQKATACKVLSRNLQKGSVGTLQEAPENATEQATYDWAAQWYPMAFIQDLDPKKPHAGARS